jgi:hypothetical protein
MDPLPPLKDLLEFNPIFDPYKHFPHRKAYDPSKTCSSRFEHPEALKQIEDEIKVYKEEVREMYVRMEEVRQNMSRSPKLLSNGFHSYYYCRTAKESLLLH